MQPSFPDSPEACALMLFAMVLAMEPAQPNEPARRWALDLFADCLRVVHGKPRLEEIISRH